jgi:peptide alpha-N-acetyltransferase
LAPSFSWFCGEDFLNILMVEDTMSSITETSQPLVAGAKVEPEKSKVGHVVSDSSVTKDSDNDNKAVNDSVVDNLTESLDCISVTDDKESAIAYLSYSDETQMPLIMRLIQKDLSEPYSIYTYRYFIHNWPNLCFLAMAGPGHCVGAIVCKLDLHKKVSRRGYIAMLAVDEGFRKRRIGSTLVKKAIEAMIADDADEVVLETEITNKPALKLYENLGFVRDKRLFRYYLNGVDASRLKLWLR